MKNLENILENKNKIKNWIRKCRSCDNVGGALVGSDWGGGGGRNDDWRWRSAVVWQRRQRQSGEFLNARRNPYSRGSGRSVRSTWFWDFWKSDIFWFTCFWNFRFDSWIYLLMGYSLGFVCWILDIINIYLFCCFSVTILEY